MVPQMVPAHGVHRAEHQQAVDEQHDFRAATRQAERVMAAAVHDAQPGQEEDERKRQRERVESPCGKQQRAGQPRQRQQHLAHHLAGPQRHQVAPGDLAQRRIELSLPALHADRRPLAMARLRSLRSRQAADNAERN